MIIQILDHITEEIKQIRIDVFMKEQGFEDELMKSMRLQSLCSYPLMVKRLVRVDIFQVTQLEMHILGAWRYVSCIVDNI